MSESLHSGIARALTLIWRGSIRRCAVWTAVAAVALDAETLLAQGRTTSAPVTEFRPSDTRPKHDDAKLAKYGIRAFESKRLKLYTDIDPDVAKTLPRFIDAAYGAWVEYFGELPSNRERTAFQVTGYLMADRELFRDAGLIPGDLPDFIHGRHRGAEFWMNDQKFDYYRRHLMIHEATHCYMTILGGPLPPVWYLEGMAEHFGTHRVEKDGTVRFRVMPDNIPDWQGLGRIPLIREDVAAGRGRSFDQVLALVPTDYLKNDAYAWSWGLCAFLDLNPRWRERFRSLGRQLTYRGFDRTFHEAFDGDLDELRDEWAMFARTLQEGFDVEQAAIVFKSATPQVAVERGWQSSGFRVEAGRDYEVTATGRFTLAEKPKPWVSEPQGVSIRYFDGKPLGQLVGVIRADRTNASNGRAKRWSDVIPLGAKGRFKAEMSGTLFLRMNDSWSELADNAGSVAVTTVER